MTDERSMTEILEGLKVGELERATAVLDAVRAVVAQEAKQDAAFRGIMAAIRSGSHEGRSRRSWSTSHGNLERGWRKLDDRARDLLYNAYGYQGSVFGMAQDADDVRGEIIATYESSGYGDELVKVLEAAVTRLGAELEPLAEGARFMRGEEGAQMAAQELDDDDLIESLTAEQFEGLEEDQATLNVLTEIAGEWATTLHVANVAGFGSGNWVAGDTEGRGRALRSLRRLEGYGAVEMRGVDRWGRPVDPFASAAYEWRVGADVEGPLDVLEVVRSHLGASPSAHHGEKRNSAGPGAPTAGVLKYLVRADLPGYDGPFELEVPTSQGPDAARRRAMFSLMARGDFDPEPGQSPAAALELFTATRIEGR